MEGPETLEHVVPHLPSLVFVQNRQYASAYTDVVRPQFQGFLASIGFVIVLVLLWRSPQRVKDQLS